jgi:hypothetical protein
MRPTVLTVVWLGVGLAACQQEPGARVTVVDSAGVRITLSADTLRRFAAVEPAPVLSIGGPDAEGAQQFFQIAGVRSDDRGRIWVADGESGELRIFLPDGSHWKTRGGRGDGPGEFQRIRLLGSFLGDSVALGDRANSRLTILDPDGDLVRTSTLPSDDQPQLLAHRVYRDGSVLAQVPRVLQASSVEPGRTLGDVAQLVRARPEGPVTAVAEAPGPLWLWTGQSLVPMPFTANPGFDLDGEALHLVAGQAYRIQVFADGRLVEVYGVERSPQPVRDIDIADYRAYTEEYVVPDRRRDYLAVLSHEMRPSVLPAYTRLIVDDLRNVWAQRYSPTTSWDVFGPARRYLGWVEVPDGFLIGDIAEGKLFGIWRDDLGVEYVRVYALRPG